MAEPEHKHASGARVPIRFHSEDAVMVKTNKKNPKPFPFFKPLDLPLQTCFTGYNMHVGDKDPREPPFGAPQPQVRTNGARTRHVIFKNKPTWNKVGAVVEKKFGPGRALWRG